MQQTILLSFAALPLALALPPQHKGKGGTIGAPKVYTCPGKNDGILILASCDKTQDCRPSIPEAREKCRVANNHQWTEVVTRIGMVPLPYGTPDAGSNKTVSLSERVLSVAFDELALI